MKNFTQSFSKLLLKTTKICLLTLGFMFSGNTLFAQKVIIVGVDYEFGADLDRVAFVVNTPLVNGDVIYINDYEYNNSTNVFGGGPETIIKFTANTSIAKGQVVELSFSAQQTNNTVNVLCTSGSACGTATLTLGFASGTHNFRGGGEGIYAYSDNNDDPTDGVTEIFSVFYPGSESVNGGGGNIGSTENPVTDYPNCVVVDGFTGNGGSTIGRMEYNASRSASVSKAMLENSSNYTPMSTAMQALDRTAFSNLNLAGTNPVLTLAASPTSIVENAAGTITYTFSLSANAASNITVNFTVGGTATFGTDYTQSGAASFTTTSGTITIPSGSNSASFTIDPTGDGTLEPNETVIITATAGTGYDAGSPSAATATITNDDSDAAQPKVAISGINHGSAGTDIESFSFAALEDITAGTVLYFTEHNYDKSLLTFSNSGAFTLSWTAPATVNRGDVYVITETTNAGTAFTVTCSDGSGCGTVALINGSMSFALEGETFMAYSDSDTDPFNGVGQIHSVIYTGNAGTPGGALPSANNPSSVYTNVVITDNFPAVSPARTEYKFASNERATTVSRTLFTNTSNWVHAGSLQTVSTIRFTNITITNGVALPLLTVNVSPSSVLENSGTGMVYTFTLSQNATSNMTVNFGVSGTATFTTDYTQTGATSFTTTTGSVVIPSGSNSASVTITPVAETTLESNETVVLTIDIGTGYDAGSPNVATGTITNDDVRNVNPLVVIVGMNHGNTTNQDPDGFSFAANENLVGNSKIYFTENLFNNTTLQFSGTEAVLEYTVPAAGLVKGQVVYVVETGPSTNAYTITCSAASSPSCGSVTSTGDFSFFSGGENFYAYSDNNNNPNDGITEIHSLFYTLNGAIPSLENPTTVFPNAVVITGFGSAAPDRTEYKFAASERSAAINLTNIQTTSNYLIGQTTQALSVIPFAALSLCPASITTNPSNPAAFCPGGNTSFTVVASGSGLTYQWQVNTGSGFTDISNGGIYSGATSATLTLTNVPFANNGFTYQCVVNDCATSTVATLTVNAIPTASPSSNTPVCVGNTLNLSSTTATSYLWTGPNSFSATIQNPNVSNVSIVAGGTYTLRVTNAGGCTATATTPVVINSTPAPTSPTATPASRTTAGSVTLSATGCSGGTLTWYNASTNVAVSSPNNQPNLATSGTFNFYAKCTGTNTCVSNASANVPVTVTLCTPLGASPGNVGINWTGLESTDWNNACNWNPAWVPDATNSAVVIDLKTNQPTISGTVPSVKLIYVNSGATLTVASGGTLNSNSTVAPITLQGGNIINDGTINVSGGGSGVGISIGATANITNRGTISTNNLIGISLDFGNLTFTNESTGILDGDFKANNNILTLTNHGTINYGGGTYALSLGSSGSSVINDGTISITGGSGISNPSGSTITNNACGKILMTTGEYENAGTTTNAGLIQMPNLHNFTNTGTFTNNGVLKANTVSGITNNRMVITNACPIFTLAGSNNYTVSGIFTDAGATTSAGTYTSVGNKFTANNTIPTGTQTLYAQVTNGTCTFVVPFDFNNRKPTAVSVNNTAICTGRSVTLSGTCPSGTTLTWYTTATGGSNIGTGTSLSNSPTVATTYYASCEATNCISGRVATSEVTVSNPPFASANSNSPICAGTTLSLNSGSEGNTYVWRGPNSFTSTELSPSIANATVLATGTYTITITNASNCTSTATTAVTVNAIPTATASSNSPVCVGNSISLMGGGVGTYAWSGPNGYSSTAQSPTIASATVLASGTYTITVTGTGSCTSTATTSVMVNGLVTASVTPSTQTICSGGAITTIAITGTGTSYTWTRDNTTSATGIAASGSGDISGSLTNTTEAPITVTFTITPVGSCNGTPITATVIVNPTPTVTASTPSQSICSGASITGITFNNPPAFGSQATDPSSDIVPTEKPNTSQAIEFSSFVAGTVFNWTRDNTATVTGIAASGSGNISGSLTNTTALPVTVTFTVTPSYTNAGTTCTGTPITVTVTVNPIPLATITDAGTAFCSGSSTTLSAPANAGATYAWERSLTGIANPNEFTAFGGTAQTQVVTTSGVYRVIVTNNNCSARDTTAVKFGDIVFNGSLGAGDAQQTGRMNRFAVVSTCASPKSYPGDFTTTGARFYDSYTVSNPTSAPICATIGLTSGCGTTLFSAAYLGSFNPASPSTNYLADHGSTFPNTAFYEATIPANGTIVVVVHEVNVGTACSNYNLRIDVPGATVAPTANSNSPICAGNTLNLTGTGTGTYAWAGPNSFTSSEQSPSIANATTLATGTYTISVTNTSGCVFNATTAVTVNAISTVSVTPSTQTICSGEAITTIAITGSSYTWTRDNTTSATGIAASGSGDISGSLTNATDAPITVTFTITPVGICSGTPITATVVVNPIPTVTASTPSQTICSGASITGITFNNPAPLRPLSPDLSSDVVVPTAPAESIQGIGLSGFVSGTVFNWTRDNTATIIGIPASGTGNISGSLNNTTASPVTVTFTVTPSYTNAGTTCTGTPITVTVLVNPNPASVTITDAGTAFCSGVSTTLSAPANPNYTYAWERSLSGIANPNSFTAFGGTAQTQEVTTSGVYRVVVTNQYNCSARDTTAVKFGDFVFSGSLATGDAQQTGRMNRFAVVSTCAAPKGYPGDFTTSGARLYDSYTVTNPTNASICATIGITSGCGVNIFSAAYLGSFNPASVSSNYLADPGSSFPNTAFYEATIPANGTIVVVVHEVNVGAGCSNYNLRVDVPGATVAPTANSNSPICAGNTLNLTGTGTGTFAWTGPNSFASTLQNPSIENATTLATGTYTISVTNTSGCVFNATTAVTVNPTPTATASNNSPICSGETLQLTGGGVGTYAWAGPNGYSSTAQSPSITNATASMSGVYTITVTNDNNCTSTATSSVTVNPVVNPPVPQANTPIIFGASITLTATGCSGVNDVLKWYKSSDNSLATMPVSPTVQTNYYAKCETTLNGITCISGNSSDVTVTVLSPTPPVATGATNCLGTPTTLTATGCSGSVGTFVLKWYQNSDDALVTMPVSPLVSTDYYAKCEQTFNSVTAVSTKSNVVTLTILNTPTPVSTGGTVYNGQSISLTATGCTGTLGTFTLKWYQTADNALVTMPVSPTVTTQYYSKCEQTANSVTCLSAKSNDVTVTVVNRIFVDITKVAAPIQNGNSWATAYGNLQTGLAAATAGVEVWVAKGTYKPTTTTTRTIYFNIPSSVIVYGGFAGTEDNLIDRNFRTNPTILSGDIGTLNVAIDNSYHVVVMNGSSITTVLDGFTIMGGYANFDDKRTYSAPNSLVTTTATIETGGGIVVQNGGSPTIANCTIIQNAAVTGGGLYASDASTPTIMFCKIIGNQAGFGSALYFQDGSHGKVNNTLISGNKGIGAVYNNTSNPTITNVTFGGNGGYNGGIFNSSSQPVVKNTIIWGNSTPFNDTQSIVTNSIVQGGYAGAGNINYDPQFVSPAPEGLSPTLSGDYHLKASSLAIDRGDNGTISLTDIDLDGNLRRYNGGRVDMGAYEFQGVGTSNVVISAQTGDWEINSTWVGFKVPQLGDVVIIDSNHIVTINTTATAKNVQYSGTGQVKFKTASAKLNIGF